MVLGMKRFDAIVIGAGQAGPSLAVRLASSGRTVALVERNELGGTCVNTGCMPTKTLVASARAAHVARRAADFGVVIDGPVTIDMKRVKERADTVIRNAREGLTRWIEGAAGCTLVRGHARFESARTVRVGDELLEADQVFVNVGARARVPNLKGVERVPYLTNTSMLEIDTLPRHLVVVGGSYVAIEYAQMYRRFGAEVTIVERGPRLVGREDPDVADAVREILEREGIRVQVGAECIGLDTAANGIAVQVGGETTIEGTHVLLAVGREPNTGDLGLDRAGVEVDQRGYIVVDDRLRTNVPGIWAMGDCNGRGAFTHTSYNEFEVVASNVLDGEERTISDRIEAYALYMDPPLARAGMTETAARRAGRKFLVGKRPMTRVGRAVERDETQGFMKILVDAETKALLGAAFLGIEADEAIHGVLDVMYTRAPYTTLQRSVGIHPTVSELIPTILGELAPAR